MTRVRNRRKKVFATACVTILSSSFLTNEPSFNIINSFVSYAETYYSYSPEEDCYVTVTSNTTTSKDTSSSTNTSSTGASNTTNNVDFSEAMIKWFEERKGKVSYSMSTRDGDSSYDCSSAIYYALRSAGGTDNGYAVTTETEHDYLLQNNYELIYDGNWAEHGELGNIQAGDIFIWGKKGESSGQLGHTGIFKDDKSILHCNYGGNGITENEYESYKKSVPNHKYVYIYRNKNAQRKKTTLASNEKECMPECNTGGNPDTSNTNTPNNTSSTGAGSLTETINKFVKEHEEAYLLSWKVGGFLPSASIVQTIAETSFSLSVPSFAQAHNMGGVKFSGQPYTATKKIYGNDAISAGGAGTNVGDGTGGSYAYFKHFEAGIVGKAEFMATQNLYEKAINNTDGISTLEAIADGGWATDPSYKAVLKKLYNQYGSQFKWLDEKAISKYGKAPYKKGDTDGLPKQGSSDEDITCDPDYNGSGGDGWQKKGGSLGYNGKMFWRADNLPDEVKQYALDPKSIGLSWKNGKGWEGASNYIASNITDQCTTFSAACFGALWQKDNKNLNSFGLSGNGNQLVGQAEQALRLKHSRTPTSGDLTSLLPNHTSIVSHVFENGDILVVEQNVTGYSGQGSGEPFTWSYSYIPVASQKAENYTFINPSSIGYKVNPKAKSIG